MSKAVMISIQPYYVFLIIARLMGWNIPQEKRIEVRKNFPKNPAWTREVCIYCSKSKKSFNRIPKEYQSLMVKFLGKVIGKFMCNEIYSILGGINDTPILNRACLTEEEAGDYLGRIDTPMSNTIYGIKQGKAWYISDLVIYDKPKELGEFNTPTCEKNESECDNCKYKVNVGSYYYPEYDCPIENGKPLTRPPQSWQYVEPLEV